MKTRFMKGYSYHIYEVSAMQWEDREESQNVEDRRGMSPKAGLALGGGGILVLIIALIFGLDPRQVANIVGGAGGGGGGGAQQEQVNNKREFTPEEQKQAHFSKVIFGDTERIWDDIFTKLGKTYKKPTLVLFNDSVDSACGSASSAVGPFYCPGDEKVYIDVAFYVEMERKLHAGGEFARAYVIAHEVGHHVQNLLGYTARVDDARRQRNEIESNRASVRLELQADFLAGIWAHYAQKKFNFLEKGDIESAMNAAQQIGDDTLQRNATGRVRPDAFTHGTSQQRMKWFMLGLKTGDLSKMKLLFELPYNEL
ncbi:MAG TPA: neutral zinc metallopeptidase [Gemmatales bacterium]|nr:neutral zinc metallopeptidase [Gemmatales bacterium]